MLIYQNSQYTVLGVQEKQMIKPGMLKIERTADHSTGPGMFQ